MSVEAEAKAEFKAYMTSVLNPPTKGLVRISRFANVPTARDVGLEVGDRIRYKNKGPEVGAVIVEPYSRNKEGYYGWPARFDDDGQVWHAGEDFIIGWDGKGAV